MCSVHLSRQNLEALALFQPRLCFCQLAAPTPENQGCQEGLVRPRAQAAVSSVMEAMVSFLRLLCDSAYVAQAQVLSALGSFVNFTNWSWFLCFFAENLFLQKGFSLFLERGKGGRKKGRETLM